MGDDLWILKVHDAAGIQIKGIMIQDSQIQKTSWHLLKPIMDSSAGTYWNLSWIPGSSKGDEVEEWTALRVGLGIHFNCVSVAIP